MTKIFAAVDTTDMGIATSLSQQMDYIGCGVKLGMEFFYAQGPEGLMKIKDKLPTLPVFLDLKSHDIPTTVMKAYKGLVPLGVDYVNLHALGGYDMMKEAADGLREECYKRNKKTPKILAVTILTSHNEKSLEDIGMNPYGQMMNIHYHVEQLAELTKKAGLDGVVCAGEHVAGLRRNYGAEFVLMVPGIRSENSNHHDQKQVSTPLAAMKAGATHLVIGRDITGAENPQRAAQNILQTLDCK